MERIVITGGKADRIKTKGQRQPKRRDQNPPAQESTPGLWLGARYTLLCQRDRFPVIHIAEERQKTENNGKGADDGKAGNEITHAQSFCADNSIKRRPPHHGVAVFVSNPNLLVGVDGHTSTAGLGGKLVPAAIDAPDDLISIGIGASVQGHRDGQIRFDGTEIGGEIHVQL